MHICMVCGLFHPVIGGIETHVLELSKQLTSRGHRVFVLTSNPTWMRCNRLPDFEAIDGITVHRFDVLGDWGTGPFYPGFVKKILQLEPDVVHAHGGGWLHSDIGAFLGKMRSIPCIITAHGYPGVVDSARLQIYRRTITRIALRLVDAVIATSPSQKDQLIKRGVQETKIHLIPSGLSDEYFCPCANPEPLREKYNLDSPVILFLGRLAPVKGLEHLVHAAPRILNRFTNMTLLIVGPDNGMKRRLVKLVGKLRLAKQVIFAGALYGRKKRMSIAASDVLVLPSRSEGQPRVLHEAQAMGTPIIATRVGGVPHFIKDGENGILVDYAEPDQIAEAVERLLTDKKLRTKIIENGIQTAKSLSWTKIVPRMLQVYKEVRDDGGSNCARS